MIKQGPGTLTLSASNTYTGNTTITAGTVSLPSGQLQSAVVTVAAGLFTQSGGTNNVLNGDQNGNRLIVGKSGNAQYILSGGLLNAVYGEALGETSNGTLTQSGGVNNVTSALYVGYYFGPCLYALSGSGSLNASNEYVGDASGSTMTQNGGTNSVGSLTIAAPGGGAGLYSLQNGYLAPTNIYLDSGGTLNQTGGTLNGTLNLAGGKFAFTGGSIIGNVVLTAGIVAPGSADFGNQATFTQSGGTVAAGPMPVSGTFIYNSGVFSGRLVDNGTVILNGSFYAGQGIVNNTSITIPAGIAMGVNGGNASNTVDNEGLLMLTGEPPLARRAEKRRPPADRSSTTA